MDWIFYINLKNIQNPFIRDVTPSITWDISHILRSIYSKTHYPNDWLPLAEILPISEVTESENLQRRQSLSKPLHLAGQKATTNGRDFEFLSPGAWHVAYFFVQNPISEWKSVGKLTQRKKKVLQLIFCGILFLNLPINRMRLFFPRLLSQCQEVAMASKRILGKSVICPTFQLTHKLFQSTANGLRS